jgi:two-component system, NarL family, sensor histidine kinase UhpB
MRHLPFKYQVALGPAIVVVTLIGLIWFTLMQFDELKRQNEIIRQWARVTDRMHLAISAGYQLREISRGLLTQNADRTDLQFNYVEQSRVFSDNVLYPECFDRLPVELRNIIDATEPKLRFREDLAPAEVIANLDTLLPQLEKLYDIWWVQKRAAYITYYDDVQETNSHYLSIALTMLALCLVLASGFTIWTLRTTNGRLKKLARQTQGVSDGTMTTLTAPTVCIDEIDNVTASVSRMTQRLLQVVAVEKVLQGAEDERRRIAMDMHDQVLAELTSVTRQLDSLQQQATPQLRAQLHQAREELQRTIQTIREVIDDLHPHVLDMLGLSAAIGALTERACKGSHCPSCYLSIDADIDIRLNAYTRIMLYRIVQEVVTNLMRHAHCTQYEIRLHQQEARIVLSIEDNGQGFDPNQPSSGHGLINISERARAIGAQINWKPSRFNSGTCFELTLDLTI